MSFEVLACEDCGGLQSNDKKIVFCSACNYNQCNNCWKGKAPHKEGKLGVLLGPGGIPHDALDPNVVKELKSCLAAPGTEEEEQRLHLEDEDTTWFGVTESNTGQPLLQDLGRYASIMSRSMQDTGGPRYPKLVSFIGETGSGKSTLIKLLIELEKPADAEDLSTPIVGKGSSSLPTSADVHLYADPRSLATSSPILYADCEGMRGGDRDPVAAEILKEALRDKPGMKRGPIKSIHPIKKVVNTTKRIIKWITSDGPEHEKRARREYAVTEMYPRILYSFSDTIVFVLRNVKTLDAVVEQLLSWAHAHSDGSVNMPYRPNAIIVLNAFDDEVPSDEWNAGMCTAKLLSSAAADLDKNPIFKKYVERFRQRNHHIIDLKELLRCYYSEVTMLRIPGKNHLQLLDDQRKQLYSIIKEGCDRSHKVKEKCKMLSNSDDLQIYLQSAFDHFALSLDEPFDFVAASVKNRPIPSDFADHILQLADIVSETTRKTKTDEIFSQLTTIASSSILLDAIRKKFLGIPAQWFDHNLATQKSEPRNTTLKNQKASGELSYSELCKNALEEYHDTRAPCEFKKRSPISGKEYPCIKHRRTHQHQHQLLRYPGIVDDVLYGPFQTGFVQEQFVWQSQVLSKLKEMESNIQNGDQKYVRQRAATQHRSYLLGFVGKIGIENGYISHTTCLSCLMELPEHTMPCGHVICSACVQDFGRIENGSTLVMDSCPLHHEPQWTGPRALATLNPQFAGTRILALDGGGMKGIVELLVLRAIESELGAGLQVQQFFDLIVGTSTGGIIALGLGVNEWSVSDCKRKFNSLIRQAFTKRAGGDAPFFKHFNLFVHQSRYRTKAIEDALREAFSQDDALFGQIRDQRKFNCKVAVTSTTPTGEKAILIANYNRIRRHNQPLGYLFDRAPNPAEELRVWEAARCTSAAPGYFKPYTVDRRKGTQREFIDGGLKLNNPVQVAYDESKLAFLEDSSDTIDVLLSIGCGRNSAAAAESKSGQISQKLRVSRLHTMLRLVEYQFEVNTHTENMWTNFLARSTSSSKLPSWQRERFVRINPDLKYGPPLLDALGDMEALESNTQRILDTDLSQIVRKTAADLVASCFYFQRASEQWTESGGVIRCPGTIKCRFRNDSEEVKSVGEFLRTRGTQPCFIIHDFGNETSNLQQIEISCDDMIFRKKFDVGPIEILTNGGDSMILVGLSFSSHVAQGLVLPISGFPRNLLQKDFKHASRA